MLITEKTHDWYMSTISIEYPSKFYPLGIKTTALTSE